MAARARDPSL